MAADSGLHQAGPLGLHVDYVVGDLDSADPAAVEPARARGRVVERIRPTKDATDLELALDRAARRGARADHRRRRRGRAARPLPRERRAAGLGPVRRSRRSTRGSATRTSRSCPGGRRPRRDRRARRDRWSRCSRSAGDACGITTTGLQYPLHGATLRPGTSPRREQRARRPTGIGRARPGHAARRPAVGRIGNEARARSSIVVAVLALAAAACSSSPQAAAAGSPTRPRAPRITTVVLLTHSSFAVSKQRARRLHRADRATRSSSCSPATRG